MTFSDFMWDLNRLYVLIALAMVILLVVLGIIGVTAELCGINLNGPSTPQQAYDAAQNSVDTGVANLTNSIPNGGK
jgi:hypothetical protein